VLLCWVCSLPKGCAPYRYLEVVLLTLRFCILPCDFALTLIGCAPYLEVVLLTLIGCAPYLEVVLLTLIGCAPYLEVVLLANERGGDALLSKGDESEVAPGVGDEHVLHVAKAVEMLQEILLGNSLKQQGKSSHAGWGNCDKKPIDATLASAEFEYVYSLNRHQHRS
jgi:hypothetical protein